MTSLARLRFVSAALAAVAALTIADGTARAHVGAVVAVANFTSPPPVASMPADAGRIVAPYTFATADQRYDIVWQDGDTDPTGRFVFWYLDHHPTFGVTVDQIEGSAGLATKIDDPINAAGGYWVSCVCSPDAGVVCPTDPRSATGNCANQLSWDTSKLAPGTYWIVAVNTDPPFHVYNASLAPLVVAHGGQAPPAAIFVRPDGYGAYDRSFRAQWIATGKAPLTFDLSYGNDAFANVLDPPLPVASKLQPIVGSDGSLAYDWDVSQLANGATYFLRLKITDGDGVSTFTDSHYGVQIFHGGGMIGPPPMDLAVAPVIKPRAGCEVAPGAGAAALLTPALALLLGVGIALYFARRPSG